jgi:LysM repeat protein
MNQRKRTSRKKKLRFLLLFTVAVTVLFITSVCAMGSQKPLRYETVAVESGDSLWSIAAKYSNDDIRKTVNEIKTINNITGSVIYEGDLLKVPIE